MRTRDIKTAEQFGILERCRAFERDLLNIQDIVPDKPDNGIPFDLDGFLSSIFQVIIVPQYDIRADRDDYWEARKRLKETVVALCSDFAIILLGVFSYYCAIPNFQDKGIRIKKERKNMYKIKYTHMDLNSSPVTAACLLKYDVNPNSCFSCMAFETADVAMAVITSAADRIAEYHIEKSKKTRLRKSDSILPIKRVNGKDGKSVTLQYFLYGCGYDFATWSVYESRVSSGRAMIVFLDKDGFRCTYEFDTLADMFGCIKKDKYLAANKQILLVADEGIPIYSSLSFQPDMSPSKERNRTHIRVVFRGEDGIRRTLECNSVEEFFQCIRVTEQLNEKAEILLAATNGTLAYSSFAPQGELKKKAGLKEIMDWFSNSQAKEN